MRELIERLSYRFQLWQRERHGDHLPADPTAFRNPLRSVAIVGIMWIAGPFIFKRAIDVVAIIDIGVAVTFLGLYHWKSRWAWHFVVAWIPFTVLLSWALRLGGYAPYQPRGPSFAGIILCQFAFYGAMLAWLIYIRDRYFRYIERAQQGT